MSDESVHQAETDTLPEYVIEGARSSRSRCKTCRRKIDKGSLRLGILIEGPYGTGYIWHHLVCAAKRQFDRLERAYAERAWRHAKAPPDTLPDLEQLARHKSDAEARRKARKTIPFAEVAPSERSRCKQCGAAIGKGQIRIVLGKLVEFGNQVRTGPMAVHPGCVKQALESPDCGTGPEELATLEAHSAGVPPDLLAAAIAEIGRP